MRKAITSFRNRLPNLPIKLQGDRWLLALFMLGSGLVWFFATISKEFQISHTLPVRYLVPEQLALSDGAPTNMTVTIRASGWSLLYGGLEETFRELSLAVKNKGQNVIKNEQIRAMLAPAICPECRITEIHPSEILVHLEPAMVRDVPVCLPLVRHFKKGVFAAGVPTLSPSHVRIHGPASKVNEIEFWLADTLAVSDVTNNIEQLVTIPEQIGSIKLLDSSRVVLHAPAEPFTEKKIVVDIRPKSLPVGVTYFPAKVTLSFLAPLSQYNNIRAEGFTVMADFSNISAISSNFLPVYVTRQPAFIKNLKISPTNLRFYYQAE